MNNQLLRNKAITLRQKGGTYKGINDELHKIINKSTLNYWFRNVSLPESYLIKKKELNSIHLKKIRLMALNSIKLKKEEFIKKTQKKNDRLLSEVDFSPKTQKILLSILYLSEGAKYRSTKYFGLSSSSPDIIKFYLTALTNCYNIDRCKLRIRIQCRSDQDIEVLESFWTKITGIKQNQFTRHT
jgi:hypothetical protein